jgi:hypothetical protein
LKRTDDIQVGILSYWDIDILMLFRENHSYDLFSMIPGEREYNPAKSKEQRHREHK